MKHPRELPLGAVPRRCAQCGKSFRAMTDRQWENVERIHNLTSKRHPLMSSCHLWQMDTDVLNRALPPGPYSDQRLSPS
jgi:hypothetical protein